MRHTEGRAVSLQAASPTLILASASASRAALLNGAGLEFETRVAAVDEAGAKQAARAEGLDAEATALLLAGMKATCIASAAPEALVIGADQLLVCEGRWFDKPTDRTEARAHLMALRGRTHSLVTAVQCRHGKQVLWQHVATPRLTMRAFSDAFLTEYLAIEDKALTTTVGAYRLEGPGVHLFAAIDGEHAAILGLPLLPLLGFLRQRGVLKD
jgi:septum formation protein